MVTIWKAISPYIQSNMYICLEGNAAFVVDPFPSPQAVLVLQERKSHPEYLFLTHEHYDHISGVIYMKERYPDSRVLCTETCAKRITDPRGNLSAYAEALLSIAEFKEFLADSAEIRPFCCRADVTFHEDTEMEWHGHSLRLLKTPGHTSGGASYAVDDVSLFSGDSLLAEDTNTRYPTGSVEQFQRVTLPKYKVLSEKMIVYPGHGEKFLLGERLRQLSCAKEDE